MFCDLRKMLPRKFLCVVLSYRYSYRVVQTRLSKISKPSGSFWMTSKYLRGFQNCLDISRWSHNFPDDFKTFRIFLDDLKIFKTASKPSEFFQITSNFLVSKLSGHFKITITVSELAEYFQMISKNSGRL